jgi:hypothetical protein
MMALPRLAADLSGLGAAQLQIEYQVLLLHEAGLIWAIDAKTTKAPLAMLQVRLTMAGHEYLDAIRDEEGWRRTKEGALATGPGSRY